MSNEGVFDEAIGGFVCNFGESVKEASAVNMQVLYCTNVGTIGLARRAEFVGDDGASLPRASRHVKSTFTPAPLTSSLTLSSAPQLVKDDGGDAKAVFQCGKASENEYALEFVHPMTPFQAFGIAITAFAAPNVVKK